MPELVFEVIQESDGGYCAECPTESILTEADTWGELRKNVLEAISAYFFDRPPERSPIVELSAPLQLERERF